MMKIIPLCRIRQQMKDKVTKMDRQHQDMEGAQPARVYKQDTREKLLTIHYNQPS